MTQCHKWLSYSYETLFSILCVQPPQLFSSSQQQLSAEHYKVGHTMPRTKLLSQELSPSSQWIYFSLAIVLMMYEFMRSVTDIEDMDEELQSMISRSETVETSLGRDRGDHVETAMMMPDGDTETEVASEPYLHGNALTRRSSVQPHGIVSWLV